MKITLDAEMVEQLIKRALQDSPLVYNMEVTEVDLMSYNVTVTLKEREPELMPIGRSLGNIGQVKPGWIDDTDAQAAMKEVTGPKDESEFF